MTEKLYYVVVSFGGCVTGAGGVYTSEDEAREKIIRAERDTQCGGRYYTDPAVLHRARVQGYRTRKAAKTADISDGTRGNNPAPVITRVIYG